MKNVTLLGIDLAKNVFQLHGVDDKGNPVLRKRLTRGKLMEFIVKLQACARGETPFTLVLDDPAGNSFIENPYPLKKCKNTTAFQGVLTSALIYPKRIPI